jgi:tetratricopeptide (TPR) repeat protein/tRNA A-37 threonylcarbamoyl transferase component Bud32
MVAPEGAAMSVPSPSADRNLLFGLLALQMDFLSREQLLEAMLAWMLEKQTPLGEILTRRGVLAEEDRADIERLVEKHVRRHGGEPCASLAALRVEPDLRASLAALEDADIQFSLAPATERPSDNSVLLTIPPLPPGATGTGGASRYHKLRPHARGGLGEVFVARDEEFQREVALKEIQDRFADRADARARFLREAEVTGKLEHPGVVPVYGLGVYPDGRPYYAMRLIRGESMEEAIRRFHAGRSGLPSRTLGPARQAGPTFHSLAFRELLGRFVMVCNAVAYAHSRGVIHRDLKPVNAMLGEYGETLVVDWGLARVMDQPASEQTTAERPMQLGSGSGTAPTEMGQVVGTPAYMPPEQAEGRLDCVGVASDVFSLGATLYNLLTGQAPYSGEDVLAQARRAEVVPARQRKASVPVALEAVCQKAMARKPEDRYLRAQALAEEVQRWLAGEPVLAWPEPLTVKAGRWVRKNRVLAASAAAAALVALVLGTAGGVYRQQQRAGARQQAELGLTQAVVLRQGYRFKDATAMLEQVRGWTAQAADTELDARLVQAAAELALAEDLDRVRQKAATLVEGKWVAYLGSKEYPKVLARHGLDVLESDRDELVERIQASAVRESIVAALDDWALWETDQPRRQQLLRLANNADEPDPWRQGVRLALLGKDISAARQFVRSIEKGKRTPGAALLLAAGLGMKSEEATAFLRRMQQVRPDDFWLSFFLGNFLSAQKKNQSAADCYLVAVALRPDSAPAQYNLGNALRAQGKADEAIECYMRAIDIDPNFALGHNDIGTLLRDKGKVDEAIERYHEAIRIDPRLAAPRNNLGTALKTKGKVDEAIECFHQAIDIDPTCAAAYINLGQALWDKRKIDESIACYRKAIQLDRTQAMAYYNLGHALMALGKEDEAVEAWRNVGEFAPKFATVHELIGVALQRKGKVDEAIACFRKAIQIDPNVTTTHFNLGAAFQQQGKLDEGIACYQKAIQLDPKYAVAYINLGHAWKTKGKLDEAIACFDRGIQLDAKDARAHYVLGNALTARGNLERAVKAYRKAIELDPKFAEAHCNLGHTLGDQGQFAAALASLRRGHELGSKQPGWQYPSADWVKLCEQLLAVDGKLRAFLAGKGAPADAATQVQMADLAMQPSLRLYLTSARLYRDAFARQRTLADAHRYNAARAAALAGTGQGKDASELVDSQRAEWRKQALNWLAADLAAHREQAKKAVGRPIVRERLAHWLADKDLAGVRDERSLARLPAGERESWRKVWGEVAVLLKKVEQK